MNSEFGIRYCGVTVKGQRILNEQRARLDDILLTKDQVVEMINSRFAHYGDLTKWGKEIGVGAGSVSCAACGNHIVPGILAALGLERVVMYRKKR